MKLRLRLCSRVEGRLDLELIDQRSSRRVPSLLHRLRMMFERARLLLLKLLLLLTLIDSELHMLLYRLLLQLLDLVQPSGLIIESRGARIDLPQSRNSSCLAQSLHQRRQRIEGRASHRRMRGRLNCGLDSVFVNSERRKPIDLIESIQTTHSW